MNQKPRWQYRFDNFKRAYFSLQEAVALRADRGLTELEKEGVIQRFEYTMDLGWKTIKDYLESQNLIFDEITPRVIIKTAFETKFISQGETWLEALDTRNKMSHTYNSKEFELAIKQIAEKYLDCFSELYEKLACSRID